MTLDLACYEMLRRRDTQQHKMAEESHTKFGFSEKNEEKDIF